MTPEQRIEVLERATARWQICVLLLIVTNIVLGGLLADPTAIELGDIWHRVKLDDYGLKINETTTVSDFGVSLSQATENNRGARAYLVATEQGASIGFDTGGVGVDMESPDRDRVIRLKFKGRIGSEIDIDSDTGEWTLRRYHTDAFGTPFMPTTTQLLPPLP